MELKYKSLKDKNLINRIMSNVDTVTEYTVYLSNGKILIDSRYLIINLIFWKVLMDMNIQVRTDHIFDAEVFSEDNVSEKLTEYFDEIKQYKSMEMINQFKDALWTFFNYMYNFALINCSEYVISTDILKLSRVVTHPKVKELQQIEYTPDKGTDVIELELKEKTKTLIELLTNDNSISRDIGDMIKPGLLNTNQLAPMFIACGVRTDINDVVIRQPIQSCIVRGLQNVQEYVQEHFAAKKSIYYNSVAIKDSQYFGRKQQLASLPIIKTYFQDCGSLLTIPFYVRPEIAHNLLGKHIVVGNEIVTLTKKNIKQVYKQFVHLRSPITCKHQDGCCVGCGSELMYNYPYGLHIGMQNSSVFTSQVTQLILSNKHVGSTKSLAYKIPEESALYFTNRMNGIFWRKDVFESMGDWKIGVSLKDILGSLDDVRLIDKGDVKIQEERFSNITGIALHSSNRGDTLIPLISDRHIPFFTLEMLRYIGSNNDNITINEDIIWIDMNNFDRTQPIFRAPVLNESMIHYVKKTGALLQEELSSYTNAADCLRDLSDLIYMKVNVNIFALETLLKAYMIVDQINYSIPVVEDIEKVTFLNNAKVIGRSISNQFAFQSLYKFLISPSTYLYKRTPSIFDNYFGFRRYS